jgi:hypothetical protein
MKICILFAALSTASLAAVPAAAHVRSQACGHVSPRPAVHRTAYHPVRRAPVRHLAAHNPRHGVRYADCGCRHATRARIVYDDRAYLPRHWHPYFAARTYYEPRPIFYRPRMIVYREDFPMRRFHRYGRYGGGFEGAYFHRRDRDFDRRRYAMAGGWGR